MMELFIFTFIFVSVWITWFRPFYNTYRCSVQKEWLEYWVILGIITFVEFQLIPDVAKQVPFNFVRTMTLFVLSERAIAVNRPKPKAQASEEPAEELGLDSFPEQLVHLEKLNGSTSIKVIEKLLSIKDISPFQIESTNTWASPPKTIASFTAYKLAVLLSGSQISKEKIKGLTEGQTPRLLIEILLSGEDSERDNSLLCMSYLTEKSKKMQKVLFELNILQHLRNIIVYGNKHSASIAAVKICRKIYKTRDQAKEEFMRSKMSFDLINLMKSSDKETVVEICQAVNDLVMKDDSILNRGLLKILANQGLYDSIQSALSTHGSDSKLKLQLKCLETLINSS